jgi:hypothetical protein
VGELLFETGRTETMISYSKRISRFYRASNVGIHGMARRLYAAGEIDLDEACELWGDPDE